MKMSIEKDRLLDYLIKQLEVFFPDGNEIKKSTISEHFDTILERVKYCFSKINRKYFQENDITIFNHLHGDQYSMFLYFASNTLYKNGSDVTICEKIFQLNKLLNGIDAFYEIELPDTFLFIHPLGTVLGRAKYSNYFTVYQGCNVGSNKDSYPTLNKFICMHPGSSILGNCNVGDNCRLATKSLLLDESLEENTLYIGGPKNNTKRIIEKTDSTWII